MDRTRVFSVAERVIVFDTLDEVLDRLARTALEAASPADAVTIEVVDRVAGTVAVMKGLGVSPAFLDRTSTVARHTEGVECLEPQGFAGQGGMTGV